MSSTGSVPAGTRVGRYEIVSLLGRGGMGEVYAAHDANLGRQVALKILPSHRTSDPERVARFVREARASSALNHPAIVSVHDAGAEGNLHFLAMELIEGESLSEWIRKGRNLRRGVELMAQVAEGLAGAHANGIIHRDLKPDNIMVSRSGYAKILDFGVAKLTERTNGRRGHTGATTPTSRIGTTAYMSPEQVEGRAVDHRTDVFSFGVVLYEVITGTNPFASPQYADTLHNIVHLDPPLEGIPPELRRIVRRCLRKDPDQRYHSLKDAALDLRESIPERRPRRLNRAWVWAIAILAVVGLAAFLVMSRRANVGERKPEMVMTRLTNSGKVTTAGISPDGNYVAYAANEGDMQALYVKQIATGTITPVAPAAPVYYFHLRVSPDGNYIYYASTLRSEPNIAHIYQVPLLGGTPRRIAADTEFWYSLSPDGTRVVFRRFNAFDREHRLTIARVDGGGEEIVLRKRHPEFIQVPVWSPEGDAITYASGNVGQKETIGLYELTLDSGKVERIPAPTWTSVGSYAALPDGSGYLVTAHNREEMPQIWFLPRGETTAKKVTSDISAYYSVTPTADSKSFVAVRDVTDSNIFITTFERSETRPVTSGIGNFVGAGGVRWLAGGELLFTGKEGAMPTFFVVGPAGGTPRRLIHNMPVWNPSISRDGRRIAFVSDHSGQNQIWIMDSNGENLRQLTADGDRVGWPVITPDGSAVVYLSLHETQYAWRIDVDGKGKPVQLTDVPTSRASLSGDGKWLLCRLRSKEPNVPLWRTAIVPLDRKSAPRFFQVPQFGGPPLLEWHPDGRSFLYLDWKDGAGNVWEQPIDGGEPRQITFFESGEIFAYDMSPDGRTIALSRGEPSSDAVLIRNFR